MSRATPDPLAALRSELPGAQDGEDVTAPEPEPEVRGYGIDASPAALEALTDAIVTTWHASEEAQQFLHRGGVCGCRMVLGIGLGSLQDARLS